MKEYVPYESNLDISEITKYNYESKEYLLKIKQSLIKENQELLSRYSCLIDMLKNKSTTILLIKRCIDENKEKLSLAIKNSNYYFADVFNEQIHIEEKKKHHEEKKHTLLFNEKLIIEDKIKETKQKIDIINDISDSIS